MYKVQSKQGYAKGPQVQMLKKFTLILYYFSIMYTYVIAKLLQAKMTITISLVYLFMTCLFCNSLFYLIIIVILKSNYITFEFIF